MGDRLEYAVEGLVPWDVLQSEPGVTFAINFCLRTTGVDFPEGEFSDVSDTVTYSTTWANMEGKHDQTTGIEGDPSNYSSELSSQEKFTRQENKISRTRKEVIKAVLNGHKVIELERRNEVIAGEGVFESFL